jgi:hypothetical protein
MTPQKVNNHTINNLNDSKRMKSQYELKRMMLRMINEIKEGIINEADRN